MAHEASGNTDTEGEIPTPAPAPERTREKKPGSTGGSSSAPRSPRGDTTRLFISLGRAAHIRPQDIVGAIAGESSLSGRQIGAIEIAHKFSIVEVPADAADEVITALRATKIKGRSAKIELWRPHTAETHPHSHRTN